MKHILTSALLGFCLWGCSATVEPESGGEAPADTGAVDTGAVDTGAVDTAVTPDAGPNPEDTEDAALIDVPDAESPDSAAPDAEPAEDAPTPDGSEPGDVDETTGDAASDAGPAPLDTVAGPDADLADVGEPSDVPLADVPSDLPDSGEQDVNTGQPDTGEPDAGPIDCSPEAQSALYLKRIQPLVSGAKPSSCNQCHLSGMDLSMYVQGTPCKTMACMIQKDLVDLDTPANSGVLAQILQAEPNSGLITEAVIAEEHDGFLEWIEYSKACHQTVCGDIPSPCSSGVPDEPDPDGVLTPLGGCTEPEMVASFEKNVFEWRLRCHGCHSNCDPDWNAPCWLQEEFDETSAEATTQAAMVTMYNLIGLGAIDPMDPMSSNLILKPLKETVGGIYHGGGDKFTDDADPAYQDFALFTNLYSACFQGQELPMPVVEIVSPVDKKKVTEGTPMLFLGKATDAKDGDLESIVWTSDKVEEPIGEGKGPFSVVLPYGKHVITATATDSDGNIGTRKVKVWVKLAPTP